MKTKIAVFIYLLTSFIRLFSQDTPQEIVLVGTMHEVPKIVKKSYKPMLRLAKKYNPEAIFMETPMPNDTKSWEYLKNGWSKSYQKFYKLSDSLKQHTTFNHTKFQRFSSKKYEDLQSHEIQYLINAYAYKRDNGNYGLMKYLLKQGMKGAKHPTRHKDGDLTYKLALIKNLKITNMDDQQTNKAYHEGWNACIKKGVKNGNNAINNQLNKKDYRSAMIPAIFRRLGSHTNKRKTLQRLHQLSAFEYVTQDTEGCKKGRTYWNERNSRIAKNIGKQVLASGKQRNIVFIGASHIIGIEKELKTHYPKLKIILMNEL